MSDEKKRDEEIHDTEEPERPERPERPGSVQTQDDPLPEPPPPGGGSTEGPGK